MTAEELIAKQLWYEHTKSRLTWETCPEITRKFWRKEAASILSLMREAVEGIEKKNPYQEGGNKFESSNACCSLPETAYNEAWVTFQETVQKLLGGTK